MQCGNDNNWKLYREYRNKVNSCIRKSKQFWNLVKKLYPSKDTASVGVSALEVNGKLETAKQGIASCFATILQLVPKSCVEVSKTRFREGAFEFC